MVVMSMGLASTNMVCSVALLPITARIRVEEGYALRIGLTEKHVMIQKETVIKNI